MVNVMRELARSYALVVLCCRIGSWVCISLAPEVVFSLRCKLYYRITHIEHIGQQSYYLAFSISHKKVHGCVDMLPTLHSYPSLAVTSITS